MAYKAVFIDEINNGLHVTPENKLAVKAGRNVVVDTEGVHVEFAPIESRLNTLESNDTTLDSRVGVLEKRGDVRLSGAVVEGTTLKLTTTDGVEIPVDLAKFLNTMPTAQEIYNEVKEQVIRDVKNAIKGEALHNLSGNTLGYLIKADE